MHATHTPPTARAGEPATCPRPIGPRNPAGARYFDPRTHRSWSGRGAMPPWLQAQLAAGHALAEFEARSYTTADGPTP